MNYELFKNYSACWCELVARISGRKERNKSSSKRIEKGKETYRQTLVIQEELLWLPAK
jgi:hypothetical protein